MKVVSLFSGCGGLDLGFKNAGFEIIWANDIFLDAVETYKSNLGNHIIETDISTINSNQIPHSDGVIGGFPCQGFSVANTGRIVDDSRNHLYREFVRVVQEKKPKFFLAENVKGIRSLGKGAVFRKIINDFTDIGYNVYDYILNAADYGVPQKRERVFLFGFREDLRTNALHLLPPRQTHSEELDLISKTTKWISIGEALSGIPEPEQETNLANHCGTKYKMRFNGYLGHRRIDPNAPAPTITARGDDKGGVVIIHHPNNKRRLTVREAAVIQSFPIDFVFSGSNTNAYRQIANAVPPVLAHRLAEAITEIFDNLKKNEP